MGETTRGLRMIQVLEIQTKNVFGTETSYYMWLWFRSRIMLVAKDVCPSRVLKLSGITSKIVGNRLVWVTPPYCTVVPRKPSRGSPL